MSTRWEETTHISLHVAVHRSGLTQETVRECVERRLVNDPLDETDLAELRRIRRLQELGVNLPGIEIILNMRRRIEMLQVKAGLRRWAYGLDWLEPDGIWQRLLPGDGEWE